MDGKTAARMLGGRGITGFDRDVLVEVCRIRKGRTKTYREIAALVGRPKAYRAVGNALNRNPFPMRIPCHRVVRSDGTIGGYRYGRRRKAELLAGEGAKVR